MFAPDFLQEQLEILKSIQEKCLSQIIHIKTWTLALKKEAPIIKIQPQPDPLRRSEVCYFFYFAFVYNIYPRL